MSRQVLVQLQPQFRSTTFNLVQAYYKSTSVVTFSLGGIPYTTWDTNVDGKLDEAELWTAVTTSPAHLRLHVKVGKDAAAAGVKLAYLAPQLESLAEVKTSDRGMTLSLPGFTAQFAAAVDAAKTNYEPTANSMIAQYDGDGNKYLEREEVVKKQPQMGRQFDAWDSNGDGMVFANEIKEFYELTRIPYDYRVTAAAGEQRNKLFAAMDTSGDRNISLREMIAAAGRLAEFDFNADKQIALNELPESATITFGRGNVVTYPAQTAAAATAAAGPCPDWFTRMDQNADGDITAREFLGTCQQFRHLDTNRDGFIDRAEAGACQAN